MVICREQLKADEEVREKSEVEKKEQRTTMNKHLVGLFGQTKGKRAYEQVWSLRPIYFFKVSGNHYVILSKNGSHLMKKSVPRAEFCR